MPGPGTIGFLAVRRPPVPSAGHPCPGITGDPRLLAAMSGQFPARDVRGMKRSRRSLCQIHMRFAGLLRERRDSNLRPPADRPSWRFRVERGSAGIPAASRALRPQRCGDSREPAGASCAVVRDQGGMRCCLHRNRGGMGTECCRAGPAGQRVRILSPFQHSVTTRSRGGKARVPVAPQFVRVVPAKPGGVRLEPVTEATLGGCPLAGEEVGCERAEFVAHQ